MKVDAKTVIGFILLGVIAYAVYEASQLEQVFQ